VRGGDVLVPGRAAQAGHRVGADPERVAADHRGRYAGLFEQQAVGDRGRAAGPAVAHPGDDDIALSAKVVEDLFGGGVGDIAFHPGQDRLDPVLLGQQARDLVQELLGVALGVGQQAQPQAGERLGPAGQRHRARPAVIGRPDGGIDEVVEHGRLLGLGGAVATGDVTAGDDRRPAGFRDTEPRRPRHGSGRVSHTTSPLSSAET
jgi:hypothetical protein